ncbi:MAG: phosphatase PAP2 family protein [Deltaproteobacteria bacterium]|nr:phosphatase PAP2 family protein [Deltaproteobacteria bacterium]
MIELDEQLFLALNHALSGQWTTEVFAVVTRLGNGLILAGLIIVPMLVFDRLKLKRHVIPMVLAVAISGGLVNLMKIAVDRPRPADHFADSETEVHVPRGTPSDRSFPSGHTQTAFGAATYLACIYPAGAPAFLIAALLVGISRIALGVHFPLDVFSGAVIGAAFSIAACWIGRRIRARRGMQ